MRPIAVELNGRLHEGEIEPRTLLSDWIRAEGLTGTNVGCEHGVCGACTVQLDGEPVRSCLTFAVQADGHSIRTVEALAEGDELHPLQRAFQKAHALQCGFCTPGFLMTLEAFLRRQADPSDDEIREALAGNLCRCTGYTAMVEAVASAARRLTRGPGAAGGFHFTELGQADAEAIAGWHYPEPYTFYDWTADPGDLRELLDPALRGDAYWAVKDAGELVGYFEFKPKDDAVEIGLGLRPDLTGRGLGASFLAAGLDFARARFARQRFTLAVATFNERAIKVYERAGFTRTRVYMHSTNGAEWEFVEMSRPA